MLPRIRKVVVVCGVAVTVFMAGSVWAEYLTPDLNKLPDNKISSLKLYLTAPQAFEKKSAMLDKALLLDIRTQAEIQFVGWADISDGNIPYEIMQNSQWDEKKKEFKLEKNPDFLTAVEAFVTAKGLSKEDPIILLCRSGNRSSVAATLLQKAGFKEVYSVVDGFEGDKAKEGDLKGKRVVNGWKNAGLQWSYDMDVSKMYLK